MTQQIDWTTRGISWVAEDVSKQHGAHATDRVIIGKAQIPQVVDLDMFRKEYGDACILGILDGTSIRVMAQDVSRSGIAKKFTPDEIRSRIDARLRGIRNRTAASVVVKEVRVHTLPNGVAFTGTTEVEFQQEYAAALIDAGVPSDVALTLAQQQKL